MLFSAFTYKHKTIRLRGFSYVVVGTIASDSIICGISNVPMDLNNVWMEDVETIPFSLLVIECQINDIKDIDDVAAFPRAASNALLSSLFIEGITDFHQSQPS
ncbi:hypothetical protein GOP47_0005912 [Adiantum capillus-veneris]|uniref:Uncharacterized protein n=1 Tax=Adiantum capillus-veneris TaxID=13818 RepID=A0A9D4V1W9_ADICA|nr:hypothetical protein GOP47_0005912 [Adiantum capillus-veneris]